MITNEGIEYMNDFKATRVRFSHTQHLPATADRIFPLLCPTREYEWIPMWECSLVYSESGYAEEGCVFTTNRAEDGDKDVWVISRHEPNKHIQFVRTNSLRTIKYDIRLNDNDDGTTLVSWEQQITGLNEDGNRFVSEMRESNFIDMVSMLEKLANHYLQTGTMMKQ